MRKIALIPARGGSKRIPNKNIKLFCQKPIISYPLKQALQSGLFDEVVVSTDSEDIAQIALRYGASVPFMRPTHLSDDFTPTALVAAHAAKMLQLEDDDLICIIYPTAVLLRLKTLKESLQILIEDSAKEFSFGVVAYDYNPLRSFYLRENGLEMFSPQSYLKRSQDLETLFHDVGQFYWGRVRAWIAQLPIFAEHSKVIVLRTHQVQDIDTQEDWLLAEMKYELNLKNGYFDE